MQENIYINELKKILRPELINRIDDVIVFNPLSEEEVNAYILLGNLYSNLKKYKEADYKILEEIKKILKIFRKM